MLKRSFYQDRLGTNIGKTPPKRLFSLSLGPDERSAWVVRKRPFSQFSLCLSRACLGKMIVYIYKWHLKNAVYSRDFLMRQAGTITRQDRLGRDIRNVESTACFCLQVERARLLRTGRWRPPTASDDDGPSLIRKQVWVCGWGEGQVQSFKSNPTGPSSHVIGFADLRRVRKTHIF
jgi:hypothetical protein